MHVYFSCIGGVGIGPLAMLALDSGYMVSGSDLQHSEMVSYLRDRGARVYIGQDGSQIAKEHIERPIDWFVYSSALPSNHPELTFVREENIRHSKRDEFLNLILQEKNLSLIAVSGTHGKTTTTGMIIWTLQQLQVPTSYSIGTSLSFGPPAKYQAGSDFFIYECDEFDRNFLNFQPHRSIISSFGYDHSDTYPTRDDYKFAFQEFIRQCRFVYLWNKDAEVLEVKNASNTTVISESDPGLMQMTLKGELMRKNAWLAAQCLNDMLPSTPMTKIIEMLNQFPGTNRRMEEITPNIFSDYAHHPDEIAATIDMALEQNQNVAVVYQPHQNIRQHEILAENGYQTCFKKAKVIYWLPTYQSRENPDLPILTPAELMAATSDDSNTQYAEMNDDLWHKIQEHQKNGDLIVAMSAGDLDHWLRERVNHETTTN